MIGGVQLSAQRGHHDTKVQNQKATAIIILKRNPSERKSVPAHSLWGSISAKKPKPRWRHSSLDQEAKQKISNETNPKMDESCLSSL